MSNQLPLRIQQVKPDFNRVVEFLQAELRNKDSWKDIFAGSTGQTLIEFAAAVATYSQHSIESLFLESFLPTAKRDTSIYTIARMLGVRLGRRLSPMVGVVLRRSSANAPLVIPKFTQMGAGSVSMVNVEPLIFEVGHLETLAYLYVGTIQTQSFVSNGENFQEYVVEGQAPFSVSDQHLEVRVNNIPWRIVHDGLWNHELARVVNDSTDGEGRLRLLFGDDQYGIAPNPGDIVTVTWVDTLGVDTPNVGVGNSISTPFADIKGSVVSAMTPGANQKPPEFYRLMAPFIFNEKDKPVTKEGYMAKALEYPGVIDAKVFTQRDLNPYDLRLMNVIHIAMLNQDGSVWTSEVQPPDNIQFFTINNGGNLPVGNYEYLLTSVNEIGESQAGSVFAYTNDAPGSILLRWPTVENARAYRVYGRSVGSQEFLAEVIPSDVEKQDGVIKWVDDGLLAPIGVPPAVNTTQASWWTFSQWMDKYKHASIRLIQKQVVMTGVDISVDIYTKDSVDSLLSIRTKVYEQLVALFQPRLGSIGRKIALSDIVQACAVVDESGKSITDYVKVLSPTADQVPTQPAEYFYAKSISISIQYTDRIN